jgi:hypothetical protein
MLFLKVSEPRIDRVGRQQVGAKGQNRAMGTVSTAGAAALVSVLLLLGSLVAGSVVRLNPWSLGFSYADRLVISLRLNADRYRDAQSREAFEALALEAVSSLPGVRKASVSSALPILAPGRIRVVEKGLSARTEFTEYRVHSSYFDVLGIALERGRRFADAENEAVAIVSQACSGRLQGQDALGAVIDIDGPVRIVGVAADVVSRVSNWDTCALYVPLSQPGPLDVRLTLLLAAGAGPSEEAIRSTLARVDPTEPVDRIESLADVVRIQLASRFAVAKVVFLLTAVGWLIGLTWFTGTTATIAEGHRTEIGVRLAIGGTTRRVCFDLLHRQLGALLTGTALGLAVGGTATTAVRHFESVLTPPDLMAAVGLTVCCLTALLAGGLWPLLRYCRRPIVSHLRHP